MSKKVVLCILDGWGLAEPDQFNAIANAHTPAMDRAMQQYGWCTMQTDGHHVGLPEGQVGTSESNHLVIGTGQIPRQNRTIVDDAIADGSILTNETLLSAFAHCQSLQSVLHLTGVLSDGGVHSHNKHLYAILEAAKQAGFSQPIKIHVFTDGRDTPPLSAATYLQELEEKITELQLENATIASLQGRYYLDRDKDWAKTDTAVGLLTGTLGTPASSWRAVLDQSYAQMDETERNDQYHAQYQLPGFVPVAANDAVLMFHFRADRSFQLLSRMVEYDQSHPESSLWVGALFKPAAELPIAALFAEHEVSQSLAKVLSEAQKTQFHCSETEKHVHVTYFFNGKHEVEFSQEKWQIFESNGFVKPYYHYDPHMRASEVTSAVIENIANDCYDFQIINLCNTDMVGHTGSYEAALTAAQGVDYCVEQLIKAVEARAHEYALLITADHGNSDIMWDYEANQPHTAHTHSPVPCIIVTAGAPQIQKERPGLSDIAPTILDLMDIPIPAEMTGSSLL